jgi:Mn2+/Fe2+ NRAMP family transporter
LKKVMQIALGVVAALGGFVDIGELVFNTQAGAEFGYQLLWTVPVGVVGIATYAEMCGRVATITKRPVFDVVRQRLGFGPGLLTLIASEAINILTVAAEVGGIALILQLYFADLPFRILLLIAAVAIILLVWVLPFEGIERVFGYGGLFLIVYIAAAVHLDPDWGDVGKGFIPHWQTGENTLIYWYFAVGVIAAALVPYEVYFYSSGAVEEGWDESQGDLTVNKMNAIFGFALGGVFSVALIIVAAVLFHPLQISPEFLGTTALGAQISFGEVGLLFAFLGMMFAVGGAAIESAFAGAYTFAQFLGWEWGKSKKARKSRRAPGFTSAWVFLFLLAFIIDLTGANPVLITEYAVVLAVVALPLTYLPVLLIARDERYMGERVNGRLANVLGIFYLGLLTLVSVVALPLLFATNHGSG